MSSGLYTSLIRYSNNEGVSVIVLNNPEGTDFEKFNNILYRLLSDYGGTVENECSSTPTTGSDLLKKLENRDNE